MTVEIIVEFPGIQTYISSTATLLDAVGRSAQVENLTDPDFEYSAASAPLKSALARFPGVAVVERRAGSVSFRTDTRRIAKDFVAYYTRELYDLTPGLHPVVVVRDSAKAVEEDLHLARLSSVPHEGLLPRSPLVSCAISRDIATVLERMPDGESIPISAEVKTAREFGKKWHQELFEGALADNPFELPLDIDKLGASTGEHSRVAVIVADVNGLGGVLARAQEGNQDGLSNAIRNIGKELLESVIVQMLSALDMREREHPKVKGTPEELRFELHEQESRSSGEKIWSLPLRFLVSAGDDTVIVCDSRIAWSLAEMLMAFFGEAPDSSVRKEVSSTWPGSIGTANGERLDLTLGIGIATAPLGFSLKRVSDHAHLLSTKAKEARRGLIEQGVKWAEGCHVISWDSRTEATTDGSRHKNQRALERFYLRPNELATSIPVQAQGLRSWKKLIDALDPAKPDGIRSPNTSVEGIRPWTMRRGHLKSLGSALISLPEPEREKMLSDFLDKFPGSPQIENTRFGDETLLNAMDLLDQIELLDNHLHVGFDS